MGVSRLELANSQLVTVARRPEGDTKSLHAGQGFEVSACDSSGGGRNVVGVWLSWGVRVLLVVNVAALVVVLMSFAVQTHADCKFIRIFPVHSRVNLERYVTERDFFYEKFVSYFSYLFLIWI